MSNIKVGFKKRDSNTVQLEGFTEENVEGIAIQATKDGKFYASGKFDGTWNSAVGLATKDDLTPTDYSVTAGNGKSIVFNKSYKVGNLIIIAAKIKVTTTENTLLTFADSPKNQGAVFLLGKGGEYSVSSAIYGYIGNRAILTQSNQIAAGDYVHVHGVVVL